MRNPIHRRMAMSGPDVEIAEIVRWSGDVLVGGVMALDSADRP